MTIGGLSQTIKARDLGLGVGDSGPWETRLSMARANESAAARCPVSTPKRRATDPSSSSRLRSNTTVRTPSRSSCSAAVTFGPERYSTTRSGRRAATASTLGGMPSPTLHGERGGRVVAPGGPTDQTVARADGEEHLGEGRQQRHDATGGHGKRHPAVRVVDDGGAGGGRTLAPGARRGGERDESREVGAHCPAAHSGKPTPDGAERG